MNPSTIGQNPEFFVNVGRARNHARRSATVQGGNPEFLFLVNGQDDNANGWVDEGWDGVDNNGNRLVDELAEWETESWLGRAGYPNGRERR